MGHTIFRNNIFSKVIIREDEESIIAHREKRSSVHQNNCLVPDPESAMYNGVSPK